MDFDRRDMVSTDLDRNVTHSDHSALHSSVAKKLTCGTMANPEQPTEASVTEELAEWLKANWDPELSLLEWRALVVDAGWAKPSWAPDMHGRGLPAWSENLSRKVMRDFGAVGVAPGGGVNLAAPTLMNHGSAELNQRLMRKTLIGEITWTQLFSEPGNGSDLAGLTTTATRDGDTWIVNGQKVWSTSAHHADMAIIITRTDWDAPKHKGMTYFVMNMHQPGIEVRRIRQMNNHASFNEIFITDAEIPDTDRVGDVGDGWRVAKTTLSYERVLASVRPSVTKDVSGRAWRQANEEAVEYLKTYAWYPQRAGRSDLVIDRARKAGVTSDPVIRQEIAKLECFKQASEWTAARARAAQALGRRPGPEGSLGKLAASEIARMSARVHAMIGGAQGMLAGTDPAADAIIAEVLISTPAVSIAGGTDEIQRNILGDNILGLPRDPGFASETPFRDIPRNNRPTA